MRTVRSKFLGSLLRSQRIFGAVKPVRAGIATNFTSRFRPPTRCSISRHSAMVRWSFHSKAGRTTWSFLDEKHRPMHLPRQPDAFDIGGPKPSLASSLAEPS